MHSLKINDAVRVKETFENPHYHGFVGYVWDLGEPLEEGQDKPIVRVAEGYIGVCFDGDTNHRSPRGFKPEDLEYAGDYEDYARFTLGYAIKECNRFSDAYDIMRLAYQTWNKIAGSTWVDGRVKHLHEFLTEKYGIYIPRPWDRMSERFDEVLQRNQAGGFDGENVALFLPALQAASGFNERVHSALWNLVLTICQAQPTTVEGRSFLLRKYVALWEASQVNPHRDGT